MILIFLCMLLPCLKATTSHMYVLSSPGTEFNPINSIELLLNTSVSSRLLCAIACHKQWARRTFDYDSISHRCRLYEGDLTTGSIVASHSSNSIVMGVAFSSAMYTTTHNQPCQACTDSRYEQCINNICQCPPHTYWNVYRCLLQLFENQTCSNTNACRKDLNLTCLPLYQNTFTRCAVTTLPVGTTIAGLYNGTAGSTNDTLNLPRGIAIINNGTTLVVAEEGNKRVQSFSLLQKSTGSLMMPIFSGGEYPSFVMSYNNLVYVGNPSGSKVQIWPSNSTIPPLPPYSSSCTTQYLSTPMGISVGKNGSIYIANQGCHWITRWTGSSATQVAGIASSSGSTSLKLSNPAGIYVDQQHNALYVADYSNHRIQKFDLNGTGNGITVAGGNGIGAAANQLNYPLDVYVSQLNGAIYIADHANNRVQRWDVNATQGVTVAGDPSGVAGVSSVALNGPFAITLDPNNEIYLYVSDYSNHRVLRFTLP